MREVLSQLILPLPILVLLILITFVLYQKRKKSATFLLGLSIVWFLIISTPFIPDPLIQSLENRNPVLTKKVLNELKGPMDILVLGNGHTNELRIPPNSQLSNVALSRLVEGIRIHRLLPGSTLITSGYEGKESLTNAEVMANTALLIGVDSISLKLQKDPFNTYEEAIAYLQNNGNSRQLILVTSAAHMPRALYLFHKAGLDPIAAPTDFLVKESKNRSFRYWFPSSNHIDKMESLSHEYVGLVWAHLRY